MKKNKKMKVSALLFVWSLLLISIPFFVSKVETYRYKNNGAYISSEFDIAKYDIKIDVDKNNKADVIETITVKIPGTNFNGIYKSIPTWIKYYDSNGKMNTKKVEITNLRVEGEKFELDKNVDSMGIKIGSEKTTVDKGLHTYKIMYRYDMGKDEFREYDELVFRLFDNYDDTKIDNMTFTINMPTSIDDNRIEFKKENGELESKIDYSIDGKTLKGSLNSQSLEDAVTLNMILNDGYFVGQTSNYGAICFVVCLALISLSIYSFISWSKYGKNYAKRAQTVEFYPPENLDAAQIGYIYGEKSIKKLTAALLISLASKNYISIEEIQKNKYKIKNKGTDKSKKLSASEQIVYQDLFADGNEVVLSEKTSFTKVFDKISSFLEDVLDKKVEDIESRKKMQVTFELLFVGIALWIGSCLYIKDLNPNYNILYILSFISIFVTGFFAIFTSRKTSYGEMIKAKILGFRNYLNTAEKNQLNALVEEDPDYFYNILPYTYVLGISKKWIETFEKKNVPNVDLSALDAYENDIFMIMDE